jgi:hypothetical protein
MWLCTSAVTLWIAIYFLVGFALWASDGFKGNIFRSMAIDSCLDAGGRWDYTLNECEYAETTKNN